MAIPALSPTADTRSLVERLNLLVRDFNGRRTAATVATLPADPAVGERWIINDAVAATFGAAAVGGGSAVVPVYFDGSVWRMG